MKEWESNAFFLQRWLTLAVTPCLHLRNAQGINFQVGPLEGHMGRVTIEEFPGTPRCSLAVVHWRHSTSSHVNF